MPVQLSVVMPVLNEARFLEHTLESLLRQSLAPDDYEILVADGGSTDGTRELVQRVASVHPNVRLLDNPGRRSSAGRNAGWRAAAGAYVLFLDGHVFIPGPDLLRATLRAFEAGAAVLSRPQPLDPPGLTPFQHTVAVARASWLGHQGESEIYREQEAEVDPSSAGAAYRRELLSELGGYDERFDACEDVEFNERVKLRGLRALTSPEFTVRYYPRESPGQLWAQCERYGRGRARLWRKHPGSLKPTVPVPSLYFGLGVLLLGGAAVLPQMRPAVALYFAPYALAVLLESARISFRGPRPLSRRHLPLIFSMIHVGFAWGFAREWLIPD